MKFKGVKANSASDLLFHQLLRTQSKDERWFLLRMHVAHSINKQLTFATNCYKDITDAFMHEEYRQLRKATHSIETARKQLKRARRREIIGLRKIDNILAVEKNTWYFLTNNSMEQLLYSLKRINDPCREHVGNNFSPVSGEYTYSFTNIQKQIRHIFRQTQEIISSTEPAKESVITVRENAERVQERLSEYRKQIIDSMQQQTVNIESATVFLSILQESEQILSCLRHMARGMEKFCK